MISVRPLRAQVFAPGGAPPGGSSPVSVNFAPNFPGSVWGSVTGANHGLGYDSSYFSVGGKQRIFQGPLNGRWLGEIHAHVSEDSGKPFANFGLERIKTLGPAGADYGVNVWFDIDDDQLEFFGHTFYQVGVGGFIKTRRFDIRGNGYIPAGNTGYQLSPDSCFFENHIVIDGGIDAALEGFDTEIRYRPRVLAMQYGFLDFGGYYYNSADNLISAFSGLRTRVGVQPLPGLGLTFELNHDSRFDTTGFLRFELAFGGDGDRAHGNAEFTSRDLERTVRNDHIIRYQQDVLFALDPDTSMPYFVHHVDNTATPGGDGSVLSPHDSLLDAELVSSHDDIIFVHEGDGSTSGMTAGITLQDGQLFLGHGVEHPIPLLGGGTYILCNDTDGNMPTITNSAGLDVVTLADRNTVAGFNIDGENVAQHGIFGDGATVADGALTNTIIRDNVIFDTVVDGLHMENIDGVIVYENEEEIILETETLVVLSDTSTNIIDNRITDVGDDAIEISGIIGTENTLVIARNNIETPGDDGIVVGTAAGENTVTFDTNTVTEAGGDGIFVFDISNTPTPLAGGLWTFENNEIMESVGHGIHVGDFFDREGTMTFTENTSNTNDLDGIHLEDVQLLTLVFDENTTNSNRDDGMELVRISDPNDPNVTVVIDIASHTSDGNSDDGISVIGGNGDLFITSSLLANNVGDGISIFNFTNNEEDTATTISGNTITGNATGASAGINYFLDVTSAPPADQIEQLVISGNSVDDNGLNIRVISSGAATLLNTQIRSNPSISGFATDGVNLQSLRGATQTINVSDNTIVGATADPNDPNGALPTGVNLRMIVDDQTTGALSTMTGTVTNNIFTNPGGQGVNGIAPDFVSPSGVGIAVEGQSLFDVTLENNVFNSGNGSALTAQLDVTLPTVINAIRLIDNTFNGTLADDTVIITSESDTLLDIVVEQNDFLDSQQEAFQLTLLDDTLTRVVFEDNRLIDSSADSDSETGVQIAMENNSQLLMDFTGNTIQGHGGAGLLSVAPPNPDWSEGFKLTVADTSTASLRAINNEISESAFEGMRMDVSGTGVINALVLDNRFRDNDLAFSDPNEPTGERDFIAEKLSAGSEICLSLHNNFANTGEGYLIDNAGGGSPIEMELGINTPTPTTNGAVNITVFDEFVSTCITNIEAEEAAFSAAGFP
ncbi:MAG: right-handed parallel beta-helix repeat-containing protein [Pirellulaceae bacterium]|nr:right-handed parallel beta-helix repeat-containing protein [Pirellulaceae bacterium]